MNHLLRFLRDDEGPTAVEYAVMLALIIMAAFAAVLTLGSQSSTLWGDIDTQTKANGLGS